MDPLHTSIRVMAGVNLDFDLTFIIQTVMVLVLMVVLKRFVFDTYLETSDERERRTVETRKEADELREKADAVSARYQEALATVRSNALEARKTLRLEGITHKEECIGAAREQAHFGQV